MSKSQTTPITFRASEDLLRLIDAASEEIGLSRGEYVRSIVHARMVDGGGTEEVTANVTELRLLASEIEAALKQLDETLIRSVHLLLTSHGPLSSEEARDRILVRVRRRNFVTSEP